MERTRDGAPPAEHGRSSTRRAPPKRPCLLVTDRYVRPCASRGLNAYAGAHASGAVPELGLSSLTVRCLFWLGSPHVLRAFKRRCHTVPSEEFPQQPTGKKKAWSDGTLGASSPLFAEVC
jgi:hypothetical protein